MANNRRRMILGSGSSSRLPAAYQEVEYLQSTGTQYIDTGVKSIKPLEVELYSNPVNVSSAIYFGARKGSSGSYAGFSFRGRTLNSSTNSGILEPFTSSGFDVSTGRMSLDGFQKIILEESNGNNVRMYLDDTIIYNNNNVTNDANDLNLFLFAYNISGNPVYSNAQKIKSCIITQNGILVRNFIPCYRKADGVAGMYDTVGNQFYTNAGTGTFLVGADVGDNITRYGLVAEYLLQNNGNDTSGHGYDLTNQGGVTFDGNAAYFNANGTTSYFTINQTVIPTASSDVTISANVKCGSDASGSDYRNCIFQVHDSTYQSLQSGYEIGIKYGNARGYVQGSTTKGYEIASSKAVADDNWHNLVLTANATSKVVNLYVDGLLAGTTTASTFPSQNSKPLRIGNQWSGSNIRFWLGYMKNIRIYNRVLPDAELVKLANEIAGYGG